MLVKIFGGAVYGINALTITIEVFFGERNLLLSVYPITL